MRMKMKIKESSRTDEPGKANEMAKAGYSGNTASTPSPKGRVEVER